MIAFFACSRGCVRQNLFENIERALHIGQGCWCRRHPYIYIYTSIYTRALVCECVYSTIWSTKGDFSRIRIYIYLRNNNILYTLYAFKQNCTHLHFSPHLQQCSGEYLLCRAYVTNMKAVNGFGVPIHACSDVYIICIYGEI